MALKDEIPALSGDLLDLVARRMHAIGEPTRMRIVTMLQSRQATVQELTDRLSTGTAPLTQQNVSKHLGILYQAGSSRVSARGAVFATPFPTSLPASCWSTRWRVPLDISTSLRT